MGKYRVVCNYREIERLTKTKKVIDKKKRRNMPIFKRHEKERHLPNFVKENFPFSVPKLEKFSLACINNFQIDPNTGKICSFDAGWDPTWVWNCNTNNMGELKKAYWTHVIEDEQLLDVCPFDDGLDHNVRRVLDHKFIKNTDNNYVQPVFLVEWAIQKVTLDMFKGPEFADYAKIIKEFVIKNNVQEFDVESRQLWFGEDHLNEMANDIEMFDFQNIKFPIDEFNLAKLDDEKMSQVAERLVKKDNNMTGLIDFINVGPKTEEQSKLANLIMEITKEIKTIVIYLYSDDAKKNLDLSTKLESQFIITDLILRYGATKLNENYFSVEEAKSLEMIFLKIESLIIYDCRSVVLTDSNENYSNVIGLLSGVGKKLKRFVLSYNYLFLTVDVEIKILKTINTEMPILERLEFPATRSNIFHTNLQPDINLCNVLPNLQHFEWNHNMENMELEDLENMMKLFGTKHIQLLTFGALAGHSFRLVDLTNAIMPSEASARVSHLIMYHDGINTDRDAIGNWASTFDRIRELTLKYMDEPMSVHTIYQITNMDHLKQLNIFKFEPVHHHISARTVARLFGIKSNRLANEQHITIPEDIKLDDPPVLPNITQMTIESTVGDALEGFRSMNGYVFIKMLHVMFPNLIYLDLTISGNDDYPLFEENIPFYQNDLMRFAQQVYDGKLVIDEIVFHP
ncbi:hypothetical protein RDWZM_010597 [Blomia tropicalis]|uniref:Uncharacterized protein n=1 Tax=Blomia tropicalis TaxID=40697 RepID=A0A9Q0LZH7_BLOTA|nr:hypothetical protein RDWZM_010597 [Blomia tropicalis]